MLKNRLLNRVKAFGMTNQMLTQDLAAIASENGIQLGHASSSVQPIEEAYYDQFPLLMRSEASRMGKQYEIFYCLENSIRTLVDEGLTSAKATPDWWKLPCVPQVLKQEVASRMKAERDAAITPRSDEELDYTNFGELGVIIVANWDVFGGILSSKKAVEKVMGNLNSLRNPIAHCCPLAEDEELRLKLALRDWFRLME